MPESLKERLNLIQGSLTYRDKRLSGFDAATSIEVIEHLDLPRLQHMEKVIFEYVNEPKGPNRSNTLDRDYTSVPQGRLLNKL